MLERCGANLSADPEEVQEEVAPEGSEFADEDGDDGEKQEYVRKEFVAKPIELDGVTEAFVNKLMVKPSR